MSNGFVLSAQPYVRTPGGLDFVAIDLETANAHRSSVCAVGIAVVEDGQIVQRVSWLVRPTPPHDHFDSVNVFMHGITSDMVADAPTFHEVLPLLLGYIDGRVVVAHSAAFDIGAIPGSLCRQRVGMANTHLRLLNGSQPKKSRPHLLSAAAGLRPPRHCTLCPSRRGVRRRSGRTRRDGAGPTGTG